MKKYRIWLILVVLVLLSVAAAYAGFVHRLSCSNKSCNFMQDVDFGPGFTFKRIVGYCVHCEEFVGFSYKHYKNPPEPVGYVWDTFRSEKRPLYACPKCGKPFLNIGGVGSIKTCPKCGEGSIRKPVLWSYD
jgi:DNA-directed RNA polymerase subunit RPC12/RpoP